MNEEVRQKLEEFFSRSFEKGSRFLSSVEGELVVRNIEASRERPISLTQANQILHLCHEAGMSEGFFRYYFLEDPPGHPYPTAKVGTKPDLGRGGVSSLAHIDWGLRRLFVDALLYWGNIRSAYRDLRTKSYDELVAFFESRRVDTGRMKGRGGPYPFEEIADEDRYLISEFACKAYTCEGGSDQLTVAKVLSDLYRRFGQKAVTLGELLDEKKDPLKSFDPERRMIALMGSEDLRDLKVSSEEEIAAAVAGVHSRFQKARPKATHNTRLYLSLVNELDVYVATSMRTKQQFMDLARGCREIFHRPALRELNLRYFDPTMSAASCHEDKGLIECLMVKCARATLYFAGESDSFGKDAEVAMTMSLGKPVVILCPDTPKGRERETIFRDLHPLSRLINFADGVANGALVTRDVEVAGQLLERIFTNAMEYDLERRDTDYFRLKERLTGSVVRVQTNDRLLLETFWNYYHGMP